jgi:hypothetical protein
MGDAVPGLVVKMSCQLPSIRLELVCRETIKIKSEAFHFIFCQIIFSFVDCTHVKGDIFYFKSLIIDFKKAMRKLNIFILTSMKILPKNLCMPSVFLCRLIHSLQQERTLSI